MYVSILKFINVIKYKKEKKRKTLSLFSIKRFDSSPSRYRVVFIKERFIFQ